MENNTLCNRHSLGVNNHTKMYVTYTRIYGWSDYGGESSYQPGYRLENMMWMTLLVYDYIIPGEKNVIVIICNLYDLVCWKIFCFWVKSILGNYETTLYSYFLSGDIDWYGYRWTDVHCFSIVDHWWHYSIGDVTFIMDQEEENE